MAIAFFASDPNWFADCLVDKSIESGMDIFTNIISLPFVFYLACVLRVSAQPPVSIGT